MEDQDLSMDIISTLPQTIIEIILCLVPIKDAVRTSILSRKWRYRWVKIPKLLFDLKDMFKKSTNMLPTENERKAKTHKHIYAIYQVLLVHRGPILEFTLSMAADDACAEIDQIIIHLSKNNTLKKFSLDLADDSWCHSHYRVPLSVFSLHQLTDLYLRKCNLEHLPTSNGYGSLTSLSLRNVNISKEALIHLVSNCPLLKSFTLSFENSRLLRNDGYTIINLLECLPVIEYLTIWIWVELFGPDGVPQELPTALVHLKYFCFHDMYFTDNCGLPFLVLMIRSSPNLEKIKLQICCDSCFKTPDIDSVEDYSDVWLEHLNELEIEDFCNLKPEMEFVKLILAKSPVLMKVKIILHSMIDTKEEVKMLRILLRSPRASPVVDIIVDRPLRKGSFLESIYEY